MSQVDTIGGGQRSFDGGGHGRRLGVVGEGGGRGAHCFLRADDRGESTTGVKHQTKTLYLLPRYLFPPPSPRLPPRSPFLIVRRLGSTLAVHLQYRLQDVPAASKLSSRAQQRHLQLCTVAVQVKVQQVTSLGAVGPGLPFPPPSTAGPTSAEADRRDRHLPGGAQSASATECAAPSRAWRGGRRRSCCQNLLPHHTTKPPVKQLLLPPGPKAGGVGAARGAAPPPLPPRKCGAERCGAPAASLPAGPWACPSS